MPELAVHDLDEAVAQVASHWETLRGGHVFLTGGTGFIGTWLLETFLRANSALELGARVTVLTRDPQRFMAKAPHLAAHKSVRLFEGDVCSAAFSQENFSHVILAAADASRSPDEPLRAFDTIVSGTRRVLDFCGAAHIPNLLFLSSGAVYGPQPLDVPLFAEDRASAPSTSYGEAKRAAEALCGAHAAQAGLRVVIARCFAFLGPHLPLDGPFAAGNFTRDVIKGQAIAVRGDARTVRSYLYASDLAAWLWTMVLNAQASGIYNVGSDRAVTIAELAQMFGAAGGARVNCAPTPSGVPSRYVPSIDCARKQLGLDVRVPLDEAIRRTLRWYSETPIMSESAARI